MDELTFYDGAATGQEIDDVVLRNRNLYPTNPNLLINWYFIGGGSQQGGGQFPINQRGQTVYIGAGYTIDRWRFANNSAVVTLNSQGIVFSNSSADYGYFTTSFEQALPSGTYTWSMLADGELYSMTGDASDSMTLTLPSGLLVYRGGANHGLGIRIPSNLIASETISAVKLELGSQQTLAHQENGVWVLNEIPNYAEELAKCQRYYVSYNSLFCTSGITNMSNSVVSINMPLPVPLRAVPTSLSANVRWIRGNGSSSITWTNPTSAQVSYISQNMLGFDVPVSSGTSAMNFYMVAFDSLTISAEL